MKYEPLHHKYRPQTFAHLVGQGAIAATLVNALKQERIAPAYLFTGSRGTGKTSSARILAKSLNCLSYDRPTETPCGQCGSCVAIAQGNALDVIEIDAASNTGVDNIRELIERSQFAPVQCRYKVYTIDECHMLSNAAFNSLLKTLEEPPKHVVFVLATTDPQRVLPTIISRCQRFDFRRIPMDAMVEHLAYIATEEQITIASEAITLIAQIAQGGLRDAESLLDQLSLLPECITVDAVWDLVGAVPERDLMALLEAITSNDPQTVLDYTRRLMDRGREPQVVLQNLVSFYRDFLIAKTAPNRPDLVSLTEPTWQQLCKFAEKFDLGAILHGQQHLKSSESQLRHATQPRLWLEVTLMGLLPVQVTPAPVAIAPQSSAPQSSAPQSTAPQSSAPQSTAPQSSAPQSSAPQPAAPSPAIIEPSGLGTMPTLADILQDLAKQAWLDWTPEFIDDLAQVIQKGIRANPSILPKLIQALSTPESATPAPGQSGDGPELPSANPPMLSTYPPTHQRSAAPAATMIPAHTNSDPLPAPLHDLESTWQQVLGAIAQPSTKTLFKQMVRLLEFDGKTATAGTSAEWVKQFEKAEDNRRKILMDAFQQTFQRPIAVKFVVMATMDQGEAESREESEARSRPNRPQARDPSPPTMRDRDQRPAVPFATTSAIAPPHPQPVATPTSQAQSVPQSPPVNPSSPVPASVSQSNPEPSPQTTSHHPPASHDLLRPHSDPAPSPTFTSPNSAFGDDDVTRSAKSFANFFNGELVATEGGVNLDF